MKKILFVDDSKVQLMLARKYTNEIDPSLEVVTELSGPSSLEIFDQLKDDLLLAVLDFNMEPIDGLELLKQFANRFPVDRLVICSANAQQILADKVEAYGASFIQKPLTKEKLEQAINNARVRIKATA